ncbi:MAG TPA: fluoride efflux transporter CrcB [Solirubrobacteraceae bacterium]|nr:fluoride efflux transporter CrcB [Solirubrobacteraceae bacterium]
MSALTWVGILVLGGAGAIVRFVIDTVIATRAGRDFPLGTLAVNLSGAGVLGFVTGLSVSGSALVLVGTATVGSYTTFSTWMLETHRLRDDGQFARGLANVVISLLLGVAAVALGRAVGAGL